MKKSVLTLYIVFIALFFFGIVWGTTSVEYCTRSNSNYTEIQPESFVPDEIETVLDNEELKQIYVCYNHSNCVNVYTYTGDFLWTVATPYIRNSYFELQDDKLIIYGTGNEAYIYNSKTGEFIGLETEENLTLDYDWKKNQTENFEENNFYFDTYQVYMADSNGDLHTVVSRPWWHRLFNFGFCWSISFAGAMGIGSVIFIQKKKAYKKIKNKVQFKNRKAKTIKNYYLVTSIVHLLFAISDIIFGFFGGVLCIGIVPIAIHFIISNVILSNMMDRFSLNNDEKTVLDFSSFIALVTFLIAFISVVIAIVIATQF